ncbi:hypothetical protein Lalb_Chr11g0070561 [Lupinus albus]|uniref:Retrotransposon Copia-like N-terminal domain-containing protein n=1 Tax=Lupinus albus TaxID=3870 RepID=A0A6A4PSX1_LUPAL|nr:hypothetical protein Lalb_Chr11g0070561 [Lupinus albus]
MRKALSSKNKFKFVNGVVGTPQESDAIFYAWKRCNAMVISWITRSLSQQLAQSIIYIDNAQELWQDLKERFSKDNNKASVMINTQPF